MSGFRPDPMGQRYLDYLERLEVYDSDREPMDYPEFAELQEKWDSEYPQMVKALAHAADGAPDAVRISVWRYLGYMEDKLVMEEG